MEMAGGCADVPLDDRVTKRASCRTCTTMSCLRLPRPSSPRSLPVPSGPMQNILRDRLKQSPPFRHLLYTRWRNTVAAIPGSSF